MDRNYWDRAGRDYDGEIFDVHASDRCRRIPAAVKKYARRRGGAYDLGCGTGKFLPLLKQYCGAIHALDLSPVLIEQAERDHAHPSVRFSEMDLSRIPRGMKPAPFLFSVNMLIMPDEELRRAIWKNLARLCDPGGTLILVVPALESVMYSDYRISEWNRRNGLSAKKANLFSPCPEGGGLVKLDGVPTKHYLAEELELAFTAHGFTLKERHKVEYGWATEVEDPPGWMQAPYPWDWMAVGVRDS